MNAQQKNQTYKIKQYKTMRIRHKGENRFLFFIDSQHSKTPLKSQCICVLLFRSVYFSQMTWFCYTFFFMPMSFIGTHFSILYYDAFTLAYFEFCFLVIFSLCAIFFYILQAKIIRWSSWKYYIEGYDEIEIRRMKRERESGRVQSRII